MTKHGIKKDNEAVIQNLKDAGCPNELIERFVCLSEEAKISDLLTLLGEHRKTLLNNCHAEQKKIDYLDYLVYQIQKEMKQEEMI